MAEVFDVPMDAEACLPYIGDLVLYNGGVDMYPMLVVQVHAEGYVSGPVFDCNIGGTGSTLHLHVKRGKGYGEWQWLE